VAIVSRTFEESQKSQEFWDIRHRPDSKRQENALGASDRLLQWRWRCDISHCFNCGMAGSSNRGDTPARSEDARVVAQRLTLFRTVDRSSFTQTFGAEDMNLKDKSAVVTGGSRGLGLGLVEALVAEGAKVTVVARGTEALEAVKARLGVTTISADVTDRAAADRILADIRPDLLALNAGVTPRMGRLDQLSWEDFSVAWETDVKAGLFWLQAALNLPLKPGSRVLVGSSGAAVTGSQMSGGYAGSKRMLWFMAKYANGVSQQLDLGIRFQTIVPRQMILGTGTGDAAADAYAGSMGITPEQFVARFGAPMPPREFGDRVISVLKDQQYAEGIVFGLSGDAGVTVMEGVAA
jgi:NAD(P)-dependent dehydrogenase (short-subunit alcohol dehydrogenase family)